MSPKYKVGDLILKDTGGWHEPNRFELVTPAAEVLFKK